MGKYDELDDAILEHIQKHRGVTPANSPYLERLARVSNPYVIAWRLVDRRTQALRKADKIKLDKHRNWVVVGARP